MYVNRNVQGSSIHTHYSSEPKGATTQISSVRKLNISVALSVDENVIHPVNRNGVHDKAREVLGMLYTLKEAGYKRA